MLDIKKKVGLQKVRIRTRLVMLIKKLCLHGDSETGLQDFNQLKAIQIKLEAKVLNI